MQAVVCQDFAGAAHDAMDTLDHQRTTSSPGGTENSPGAGEITRGLAALRLNGAHGFGILAPDLGVEGVGSDAGVWCGSGTGGISVFKIVGSGRSVADQATPSSYMQVNDFTAQSSMSLACRCRQNRAAGLWLFLRSGDYLR